MPDIQEVAQERFIKMLIVRYGVTREEATNVFNNYKKFNFLRLNSRLKKYEVKTRLLSQAKVVLSCTQPLPYNPKQE